MNNKVSMIGNYGSWAAGLLKDPPELSFRRPEFGSVEDWRRKAEAKLLELLAIPARPALQEIEVGASFVSGDIVIDEVQWQGPYGPPTKALFLRPAGKPGHLPGVLAFHDHAGNKFFGHEKIADSRDSPHPLVREHRLEYYGGRAWPNELAGRGFAVLVPDVMPFGSRRVRTQDLPSSIAPAGVDEVTAGIRDIIAYNEWAAAHESIMAKSLFCAGTTWPGSFLLDDLCALEYLQSRSEVDRERIGCAGLSGGGMRTLYLAGLDRRIKAAVCVCFMTTWRDLLLDNSAAHTWMVYTPHLPRYLDLPEIFALRAPSPSFVQYCIEDPLFSLPEMRRSAEMLEAVFDKAGGREHLMTRFYSGGHKFDVEMQEDAFAWLGSMLG